MKKRIDSAVNKLSKEYECLKNEGDTTNEDTARFNIYRDRVALLKDHPEVINKIIQILEEESQLSLDEQKKFLGQYRKDA